MRVVISAGGTGGHIYPAISIINKIKEEEPNSEFLYIGTKDRMEKDLIPELGIRYEGIDIIGFKRKITFENFNVLNKFMKAKKKCKQLIKEFDPDIVIGTGGYVTAPVIWAGKKLGKKTFIHEQNSVVGLSNKYLSRYADKVGVSFSTTINCFPKGKAELTGNPCSEKAVSMKKANKQDYGLDKNKKLILIVMGSLGSRTVNDKIVSFLNAFKNSLIITVSSTLLVTLLAAMLAYYLVRNNNWISKIIFALMVASMIIPFQAIMIPLVSIYGGTLNILNHRITLIFMHVGFSMSMSVFMFHGFIKGNIPIALEEAAYIDGCTHTQTFFRIVLPLLKPIISTMVILNSLAFWNDLLLPSLVLTDKELFTLPLSTYSFYGTYSADYGTIMAGLLLCVIPILILYVVLQKQIINGVVAGAVK